jgi:hypothetical protein
MSHFRFSDWVARNRSDAMWMVNKGKDKSLSITCHRKGSRGIALDGNVWSTPRPRRFTPGNETRYPLYRSLGGPQGRSQWVWRKGRLLKPPDIEPRTVHPMKKTLAPTGFEPQTFHPAASRYTNYTFAAHEWFTPILKVIYIIQMLWKNWNIRNFLVHQILS